MSRPVTAELVGGLGNQLFGYYAGAALASRHGAPLHLDISRTRSGFTDHGIGILEFDLPGVWMTRASRTQRSLDRILHRIAAPRNVPERVMSRTYRQFPSLSRKFRIYQAAEVGEDAHLLRQPPGTRIRGYFQSWRTVELAIGGGYPRRPRLARDSQWLQEIKARAMSEHPIALHVRRGDYREVPEFGLLGSGYYEAALTFLRRAGVHGPLWVFTDEPESVQDVLGSQDGVELIRSPDGPASEMLAMSYATAHVIGNSTFSWWGAWMSTESAAIVAPDPWFVSGPTIHGLIPPWWHRVHSHFVSLPTHS